MNTKGRSRSIKKYFFCLIPFVFCTFLSIIYATKTPKDYPDPSYPYQTEGTLNFLSYTWFFIGIVITLVLIAVLSMDDFFTWLGKRIERRQIEKIK